MNIGLFGGSFDPIHNGHLSIIRGALNSGAVDCVIVIPTARNSFKRGRILSAAPYRYYMTKKVIDNTFEKDVFISDIEFSYEGISYTDTTIRLVKNPDYICDFLIGNGISKSRANEEHKYFWLCGSDILPSFDKWYHPAAIVSMASLMVAIRPGCEIDLDKEEIRLTEALGEKVNLVKFEIEGVEAASSEIRGEIKGVISGTHEESDVPEVAKEFIKTHALYTYDEVIDRVSDRVIEQFYEIAIDLHPYLKEKRLLHTINVGLLSARYAMIHGADVDKALIAGILHDCAKELPDDKQRELARSLCGDLFVDNKLLHSPAGAVFARDVFGVTDSEILDAITYHTTGREGMTTLDKIVYLADKLEPARTYTDLSLMREVALSDLDEAVRLCLTSVIDKFHRQKRAIHPMTAGFVRQLGMDEVVV